MIVYKDKTFEQWSEHPNDDWKGDADWLLNDNTQRELTKKIISLYPNFDFVLDDEGNLIDVVKIEANINIIKAEKKAELSQACEAAIVKGFDLGEDHYSMTLEDQANILAWMAVAQTGASVPYHADGKPCSIYTAEEFTQISNMAVYYKTKETTYCNLLSRQIETYTDIEQIKNVQYGVTELEGMYKQQYDIIMSNLPA